jgi:hypothetical protein
LVLWGEIALRVEMRVKPQSAGLDGEPGDRLGWRLANLRGHIIDKFERIVLRPYRSFKARLDPQLTPKLKIGVYR